ncbi:MAG TPA: type II toxin-antitoxin system PemK/MazF family toxin [Saprospiraceae bacterium]|nr:type II toxin-antitoxin system PemK/MazF family toxin [Saprospiraceae bacterium]HMP25319.1 type II toxin-antitoxin system PemK/MazF family toxin [Saprospiraceae bacterium]
MNTGDIVLIPFPFAEGTNKKVRPAVVICHTKDKYQDLVICAISSVVPGTLSENEILLQPNSQNGLRAISVLKVDRIVTAKRQDIIAQLGFLDEKNLTHFKIIFKNLVDS